VLDFLWPCVLQGIKWIKNREAAAGLVIVQQSQPKYIDKVISCIENGTPLLFENLPIDIDAGVCDTPPLASLRLLLSNCMSGKAMDLLFFAC
jgi:hypothetical protein